MAESVTVTWGKVLISPVQYNTFEVGPFSMTTEVGEGETPEDAMKRAYAALEKFARSTYAEKLKSFREQFATATARR